MQISMFSVLGPIMIGPSSSHTAGAVRLGYAAYVLSGGDISRAEFILHGSFAETRSGHGTDRALVAGILGMDTTDSRIKNSFDYAREHGLEFSFEKGDLGDVHPNTVKITTQNKNGSVFTLTGSSVGGGAILITKVDGSEVNLTGDYDAVIINHLDKLGMLSRITEILADDGINIVTVRNSRESKGSRASTVIELDSPVLEETRLRLQSLDEVISVSVFKKIQ